MRRNRRYIDSRRGYSTRAIGNPLVPPVTSGLYTAISAQATWANTLVGAKVSVAGDLSGNGRDWTQGTDANRPTYSASVSALGNRPGFVFNGTSTRLITGSMAALTEGEALVIVQIALDPPIDANKSGLYRFGTAAGSTNFPYTDGIIYDEFGSTVQKTTANPAASMTAQSCYQVYSAANDWQNFLNGTSLFSTATNTVSFQSSPVLGMGTTPFLDGSIGAFFLWSRKLTTAERAACLAWARTQWGTP